MMPQLRWSGWRDVWTIGAVVADRFPRRGARLLATCRALVVPYLMTDARTVAIGIRPRGRISRAISAVVCLLDWRTHAFIREALPVALRLAPRDWRVVDFAASDRRTHDALVLAHAVLGFADRHGACLSAAVQRNRSRLITAYINHGFRSRHDPRGSGVVELVRSPATFGSGLLVPRTGRTSAEFVRRSFRVDLESLGARVLDLGAGDSPVTDEVRSLGNTGVAADIDYRRNPPVSHCGWAVAADAGQLPFASGTFDAVLTVFVLQHVPDAVMALREALRVCRPGGRVLCHPVWSRRRLAAIAQLPGTQIVAGRRFIHRTRPAVVLTADVLASWSPEVKHQLVAVLRPAAGIRTLGAIGARLVTGLRGSHQLGKRAGR